MDKTGEEWLAMLPKHIQKQWIDNFDIAGRGSKTIDEQLKRRFSRLDSFIDITQYWSGTNEKHQYWKDLRDILSQPNWNEKINSFYAIYPDLSKYEEVNNSYSIF